MKLEDQVCSLAFANRLKELGVKQESVFNWVKMSNGFKLRYVGEAKHGLEFALKSISGVSAFTVAELGDMLPVGFPSNQGYLRINVTHPIERQWTIEYQNIDDYCLMQFADTEADARAKMLVYLIKNTLVTPDGHPTIRSSSMY